MNEPASILLCLPHGTAFSDPDPDTTSSRDVSLVSEWQTDTIGVVGWSNGGYDAVRLAASTPGLQRLAIISTPFDIQPNIGLELVAAKTLLMFGTKDPRTGNSHGTAWQKALPNARLEMVPGGGHDILAQVWARVLSHLAPRRKARIS